MLLKIHWKAPCFTVYWKNVFRAGLEAFPDLLLPAQCLDFHGSLGRLLKKEQKTSLLFRLISLQDFFFVKIGGQYWPMMRNYSKFFALKQRLSLSAVFPLRCFLLLIIPTNLAHQPVSLMQALTDTHWQSPKLHWTTPPLHHLFWLTRFFFLMAVWKDKQIIFLDILHVCNL